MTDRQHIPYPARDADVVRFTEGDCWLLARTLHRRYGWQTCAFHTRYSKLGDLHAFVKLPNGRYLDVLGIWTAGAITREWTAQDIGPVDPALLTEWGPVLTSWSHRRARQIADRLHEFALKHFPELADT